MPLSEAGKEKHHGTCPGSQGGGFDHDRLESVLRRYRIPPADA
jgi:hypothetical protein